MVSFFYPHDPPFLLLPSMRPFQRLDLPLGGIADKFFDSMWAKEHTEAYFKKTEKPDYGKLNVYEAESSMEVQGSLLAFAQVLIGMRNLKQSNQEFSMDANGYLHYLDTRLYESHSKLGNAANSEEAIFEPYLIICS